MGYEQEEGGLVTQNKPTGTKIAEALGLLIGEILFVIGPVAWLATYNHWNWAWLWLGWIAVGRLGDASRALGKLAKK
jgi:hypothetical protein